MDFYKRKATVNTNIKLFLEARERGSKLPWKEFVRKQQLALGVSEKTVNQAVEIVDPRITVDNGELVKKE